jgi:general secretion pathway protein N
MRTDAVGPRTWLLAALAAWALLAWVLALFGMGGQIRPLPDDPSLVGPLPQLPSAAPERLGPFAQYAEIAARPVFSQGRQPQPFFISGEEGEGEAQAFDFVLSSVLITPNMRLAIVQPAQGGEGIRLKVGEAPPATPGWRVVDIQPRSVVFNGPEGERTLELRVFDGSGGQMPTALTVPPPAGVPVPPAGGDNRVTGGASTPGMSAGQPAPPGPAVMPTEIPGPVAEPAQSTEQQMDAIRKRIEARRAQLRAQGESPPPPNKTK